MSPDKLVDLLSLGPNHSAIITIEYGLLVSGANGSGQLGIDSQVDQHSFIQVPDLLVAGVSVGDEHTVAINISGELEVAGSNSKGQIGLSSNRDCLQFTKMPNSVDSEFILTRCGSATTLALTISGELLMTGLNILSLGMGDCLKLTRCNDKIKIYSIRNMWIINDSGEESVIILDDDSQLWHCHPSTEPKLLVKTIDVRSVINLYRKDIPIEDQLMVLDKQGRLFSIANLQYPVLLDVYNVIPSRDGYSACVITYAEESSYKLSLIWYDDEYTLNNNYLTSRIVKASYNGEDILMITDNGRIFASGLNKRGQLGVQPFEGRIKCVEVTKL